MSGPPQMMGRYRIVGQLASGGMAEILLGKIAGPGGFERAVVIKRIHPHLAGEPEFVKMFLDEARIIARIQHPNVVQVMELGREGDDLFLAMEYLAGESLLGVMRRAKSLGRPLPHALAAHVMAKVCAGLHAAHELADEDGSPLGLVHRDVSPQNIFVTYDGAVKLLDFGIAKFAERVSQTQVGQLKGKFSYMSPEQCTGGATIDRRSDIFSLGTVLFELTTGRRLFARDTSLNTLRAICEEPIRWPCSFRSDYPRELELILRRALARSPAERYQTAAEMRRDLVTAVRDLGLEDVPEDALAAFLASMFVDRIDEKRELLRRLGAGSEITAVPSPEADSAIEIPAVGSGASRPSDTPFTAEAEVVPPPSQPAQRRRWPWAAVAVGVALGAVVGAVLGTSGMSNDDADEQRAARATIAGERGRAEPPSAVEPDVEPESSVTAAAPAAEADAPETVQVQVSSTPRRASIRLDGALRGSTPLTLTIPRGDTPVILEVESPGYETWTAEITPDENERVVATLERPTAVRRPGAPRVRRPARTSPSLRETTETPTTEPTTMSSPFRRFQ